jgi:hypothetical protein
MELPRLDRTLTGRSQNHTRVNMPNITAYLTIGTVDPSGDFAPSHWAYLEEARTPTWWLAHAPVHWLDLDSNDDFPGKWVTSPSRVVEDAMVMVALAVEKLPGFADLLEGVTRPEMGSVDMTMLPAAIRRELDEMNRTANHAVHIVATALTASVFYDQVNKLAQFPISIQVCTPQQKPDAGSSRPQGPRDNAAPYGDNPESN